MLGAPLGSPLGLYKRRTKGRTERRTERRIERQVERQAEQHSPARRSGESCLAPPTELEARQDVGSRRAPSAQPFCDRFLSGFGWSITCRSVSSSGCWYISAVGRSSHPPAAARSRNG